MTTVNARRRTQVFLSTLVFMGAALSAKGQSLQLVDELVVGGLNFAVGFTFDHDGHRHVRLGEEPGRVKVVHDGETELLLDISEEVNTWRDRGLLGFALDPHFEQNGFIYLLYVVDRHHLDHFGTGHRYNTTRT